MSTESERRLSALYTAMLAVAIDCIVMIDETGKVLEFNPAAERTFGYRREEVLGKPMVDFIVPPDLRDAHRAGLAHYLETGEARVLNKRIEIRGCRSNGDVFPVELTILRVEQPGPTIFAAYLRDLTEQKRLESVQQLLLGASDILAASLDYEETLRNLSHVVVPAFADWYAVDMVDARGALRRLEVSHRDPEKVSAAVELAERFPEEPNQPGGVNHVVRTGEPVLIPDISEALLASAAIEDARLKLLQHLGLRSAMIVPLRAQGRVVGAITLVTAESARRYAERDLDLAQDLAQRAGEAIEKAMLFAEVSESRERLEQQATELQYQAAELEESAAELQTTVEELRAANEALRTEKAQAEESRQQADEANRAKSDFLASMSHELRTPLNAIMGYSQLLDVGVHGPLEELQHEDLRRIDRSAQHLLGLINDILNFAKIEAGRLEFHLERVAVASVLSRVEELIAPQALAKKLTYRFVNECSNVFVCADEEKLIQIFVNLASNAVRYTKEGGRITIECRATEDRVITEVCDTGVGIPRDKLAAVFEPFVQVDRGYAGQRQGTGLGLAISRDLARGMGGDLTVRSEVGKGSVFSLELKREP
ncbi:MAG: ATP-binding region ATPase domain protein [Gemmatimonadetes bacterium]|nr:ATP-binding region ATPase domain protein [Gemmatimonadota bacterium]